MVRLLLVTSLLCSFIHLDATCLSDGEIKTFHGKAVKISKEAFCYEMKKFDLISSNCLDKRSCMAISKYSKSKVVPSNSEVRGSPYYKKCQDLDGTPLMIAYKNKNKWIETGICRFSDNSFISVFNTL